MVTASFFVDNEFYFSFKIFGHAGHGTSGNDIVCAAISSAVDMTIGAIKSNCQEDYILDINFEEASVFLKLKTKNNVFSSMFIESLFLHLKNISKEQKKHLKVLIKNQSIDHSV